MENFSPDEKQLRGMVKGGKSGEYSLFFPHGKYFFHTSKYSTIAFLGSRSVIMHIPTLHLGRLSLPCDKISFLIFC